MNFERAREILKSKDNITVTYQGTSIWITDLNADNRTAHVQMPMTTNNIVEVPVDQLMEQGTNAFQNMQ